MLPLADITADDACQMRASLDLATVIEYAEAMADGAKFPALVVYQDASGTNWLADGFHRFQAASSLELPEALTDLRAGTKWDAINHACGCNGAHGLRRTNADKRKAVGTQLASDAQRSDSMIAALCRVTHPFVGKVRASLVTVTGEASEPRKRRGKDGRMRRVPPKKAKEIREAAREAQPDFTGMAEAARDEAAAQRLKDMKERQRLAAVGNILASTSEEWYTPVKLIEAARNTMGGIDLDPASNPEANEIVRAQTYYTRETNGLDKEWAGCVWMNPPFGTTDGASNLRMFSEKMIEEWASGRIDQACVLTPPRIDAKWFQPFWAHAICFLYKRVSFWRTDGPVGNNTMGTSITYFGDNTGAFVAHFSEFGHIVLPSADGISESV